MKVVAIATLLGTVSCNKEKELNLINHNNPTELALKTEEGIVRAGLGIYAKFGNEYFWLALSGHNAMGENTFMSVGNFSWRWMNQPTKIVLSNGTTLTPPQGGAQATELKSRNSRAFGNDNVFFNEWVAMYRLNNQANVILKTVDDPALMLSGDAGTIASKKATLKAWAHWWKGFAYSRVGSLYIAGIITDEVDAAIGANGAYKTRQEIIAEANSQFDKSMAELDNVTVTSAYTDYMGRMVPAQAKVTTIPTGKEDWNVGGVPSVAAFKRIMNTYKARNILVNKKVEDVTQAEWTQILTLTQNGVQKTDRVFAMRTAETNTVLANTNGPWTPWRILTNTWEFLSERWVQEFKPGDARFTRNVVQRATPIVNNSGRGFQYGTRWTLQPIETGGDYVSQTVGLAEIPLATTFEENALTRAEALIRTGQIEPGLLLIDEVRQFQRAQLPAVAGTGLTQAQAMAELYRERRIALFLKGTAFYDYRRFGFACKDCQRTNAVVITQGGVVDNGATIVYNYMDYWDVPANEVDFNAPASGSAPIVFPM